MTATEIVQAIDATATPFADRKTHGIDAATWARQTPVAEMLGTLFGIQIGTVRMATPAELADEPEFSDVDFTPAVIVYGDESRENETRSYACVISTDGLNAAINWTEWFNPENLTGYHHAG